MVDHYLGLMLQFKKEILGPSFAHVQLRAHGLGINPKMASAVRITFGGS